MGLGIRSVAELGRLWRGRFDFYSEPGKGPRIVAEHTGVTRIGAEFLFPDSSETLDSPKREVAMRSGAESKVFYGAVLRHCASLRKLGRNGQRRVVGLLCI